MLVWGAEQSQEDFPIQERSQESKARDPAGPGLGPAEDRLAGCGYRRPRAEACTEAWGGYIVLTRPVSEAGNIGLLCTFPTAETSARLWAKSSLQTGYGQDKTLRHGESLQDWSQR